MASIEERSAREIETEVVPCVVAACTTLEVNCATVTSRAPVASVERK